MLLSSEVLEGITCGTIQLAFPRWLQPSVRARGTLLSARGQLEIGAVGRVNAGPGTRRTLELIAAHPALRAARLRQLAGRELASFKLDVRKLKSLGLTESLDVGYRILPRGQALLDVLRGAGAEESEP